VASSADTGCPDEAALGARLRAAGVAVEAAEDVSVRFSRDGEKRVAEIAMAGAETRRLEHEGSDCSQLTEATVALLAVLLDRAPNLPRAAEPVVTGPSEETTPAFSRLRVEAAAVAASGLVAPIALGVSGGAAYRPLRALSLGLSAEIWPERDNALGSGWVSVSAWSFAATVCGSAESGDEAVSAGLCLGLHGGRYGLSAGGFPSVRDTGRALVAVEGGARVSARLAGGVRFFATGGVFVPATRLELGAAGVPGAFEPASVAPKMALGLELNL